MVLLSPVCLSSLPPLPCLLQQPGLGLQCTKLVFNKALQKTKECLSSSDVAAKTWTLLPMHPQIVAKQVNQASFRLVGWRLPSAPWLIDPTRM